MGSFTGGVGTVGLTVTMFASRLSAPVRQPVSTGRPPLTGDKGETDHAFVDPMITGAFNQNVAVLTRHGIGIGTNPAEVLQAARRTSFPVRSRDVWLELKTVALANNEKLGAMKDTIPYPRDCCARSPPCQRRPSVIVFHAGARRPGGRALTPAGGGRETRRLLLCGNSHEPLTPITCPRSILRT